MENDKQHLLLCICWEVHLIPNIKTNCQAKVYMPITGHWLHPDQEAGKDFPDCSDFCGWMYITENIAKIHQAVTDALISPLCVKSAMLGLKMPGILWRIVVWTITPAKPTVWTWWSKFGTSLWQQNCRNAGNCICQVGISQTISSVQMLKYVMTPSDLEYEYRNLLKQWCILNRLLCRLLKSSISILISGLSYTMAHVTDLFPFEWDHICPVHGHYNIRRGPVFALMCRMNVRWHNWTNWVIQQWLQIIFK